MAQLIVRNIEEQVVKELKIRAARSGHSAEEEHRRILREVLLGRKRGGTLKKLLLEMPEVGEDSDFERSQDLGRAVDL